MATLHVFFDSNDAERFAVPQTEPMLLLFGPAGPALADCRTGLYELDRLIDTRWSWIDQEATRLAEELAAPGAPGIRWDQAGEDGQRLCFLHALKLRYHLVAVLRVVAFLDCYQGHWDRLAVVCSHKMTPAWSLLLSAWGQARGKEVLLLDAAGRRLPAGRDFGGAGSPGRQSESAEPVAREAERTARLGFPASSFSLKNLVRRVLGWLHTCQVELVRRSRSASAQTLWLCGNPRLLAPLAPEFCRRGWRPLWLFPQMALRWWGTSVRHGWGQWFYQPEGDRSGRMADSPVPRLARVDFRGIDLAAALNPWLAQRWQQDQPRLESVERSLRRAWERFPPSLLVLDEDATAVKRLMIQLARRHRVPVVVVQHGVPRVPFGFVPPAADALCLWGETSAEQLRRWGVDSRRLFVTGSPAHDELFAPGGRFHVPGAPRPAFAEAEALSDPKPLRVLLLATTRPRPQRPEPASFHLTASEYARLLQLAVDVVLEQPGWELTIKLHPRDTQREWYRRFVPEGDRHRVRIDTRHTLWQLLPAHQVVLHVASGAGVEAALAGWPVVELLPRGGAELLPARPWGMQAAVSTRAELREALRRLVEHGPRSTAEVREQVMANFGRRAAPRVVEAALHVVARGTNAPALSSLPDRMPPIRLAVEKATLAAEEATQ